MNPEEMENEPLLQAAAITWAEFLAMSDESFSMMVMAARDEIVRSMDEKDSVGELRGRLMQAICDSVRRHRP